MDKYELTLLHVNGGQQATIQATATNFTSDSLTYTWSIDNPSVLNITPSGSSITIQTNSYGTATLTCTVEDNDGHTAYNSCKVYVITTSTIWRLVTDASSLSVGDTVVIAAAGYDYAIGAQGNNNRSQATVAKNDVDKTLSFDNNAGVVSFTIAKGNINNTYAFQTEGGNYLYAAGSSKNNYLRERGSLDDNGSWKIEISSNGVASIVAQGTYTNDTIRYNSNSSLFSCYDSGQKDVAIYRLESGNALKSLSVSVDVATPYPLEQYDGRKFDCPSGVTFNATYADGTTEEIPSSKIVFNGGAALKFGDTMITASYTENGVTKSTIIDVNVHRIELQSIAITGDATTKTYLSGSKFQPADLTVTATFNYGSEDITNNENLVWNGGNVLTEGQTSVTASFTYNNGESNTVKEATYNGITVVKKTLTSISVADGYNTSFAVGDKFSFSSTVTAHFNKGSAVASSSTLTSDEYTIKVGDYGVGVIPTFGESDIGNLTVTISYTFEGVTKTFPYQITVSKDKDLVFTRCSGAITEGRYVIVSQTSSEAIASTFSSKEYPSSSVTVTDSKITNPDNTIIWDILSNGDGTYSIKSISTNNYIGRKSSSDTDLLSSTTVDNKNGIYKFSFTDVSNGVGVYKINVSGENREILYRNLSWKYYATSNANGTSYERPTLYKLGGYTPTTITNVTLNKDSATLNSSAPKTGSNANKTVQLTATVTGTGDVSQNVTWTSSDDTVATVSSTGLVTAVDNVKNNTTVTITAKSSQDSTKSATCSITVNAATTISITEKPTQLLEGGAFGSVTASITAGWDSSRNTADKITWSSSDENVLYVSGSSGNNLIGELLTGDVNKDTTVTITATLPNGNLASCDILVKEKNLSLSTIVFDEANSTTQLAPGGNGSVIVNINPGDDYVDSMSVSFSSSKSSVLTIGDSVKNGTTVTCSISAGTSGTATITARLSNGKSATLTVTVKTLVYTLDATASVKNGNSSYTGSGNVTQQNITWNASGNLTTSPWRFGGKSIPDGADRAIYSKTAISAASMIVITGLTKSGGIAVNSITVTVHSTAVGAEKGTNAVATFNLNYVNGDLTITKPESGSWVNCFYRIVFNVTVSTGSNNYVSFSSIKFYN